jgi:hypothetical protein
MINHSTEDLDAENKRRTEEIMATFSEIQDAFFFVSSEGYGMHSAILVKDTGLIYYRSESGTIDEINDDIEGEDFVQIPHKNELDLGQNLVFEFVEKHLADEYTLVQRFFQRRGAYGRFKDLLMHKGLLQGWYDFEKQHEEEALRQWCLDNEIELTD